MQKTPTSVAILAATPPTPTPRTDVQLLAPLQAQVRQLTIDKDKMALDAAAKVSGER